MQAVKNTIAENVGNQILGSHNLAPADQQFSLEQVPDLSGKVALVTGGSEGIGYGCTHTLLSRNVSKLFILSKSEDIVTDAINAITQEMGKDKADRVEFIQCDLSDWEQTGKVAFDISEKTDRLDILINNAARGIMTYQLSKAGVDLHMATNHMGHVVLTSHLLPLLKSTAEKGNTVRLVQLASNAHEMAPKDTKFESLDEDRPVSEAAKARAREIFTRAHTRLKELSATADRVALLTAWRSFEAIHGSAEDQDKIEKQMPRKVKKRRKLDDGEFEEYVDYVFPADDESAAKLAKLMANAQRWKAMQAAQQAGGDNGE